MHALPVNADAPNAGAGVPAAAPFVCTADCLIALVPVRVMPDTRSTTTIAPVAASAPQSYVTVCDVAGTNWFDTNDTTVFADVDHKDLTTGENVMPAMLDVHVPGFVNVAVAVTHTTNRSFAAGVNDPDAYDETFDVDGV